jgi:Rps23 Pro-64 3,4-dihydroxylase Tpa1-like proline 4-hydroxylase
MVSWHWRMQVSIMNIFKRDIAFFNENILSKLETEEFRKTYQVNSPFPHIVVDNLFNNLYLDKILSTWPNTDDPNFESHNDGTYVRNKKGSTYKSRQSKYIQRLIDELGRPQFLLKLERMTGIGGLISDPYQFGGGVHETSIGGKLAVHVDYNKHFKYKLDRRLNLIVYLNKKWSEVNGGQLELWDKNMTNKIKEICPIYNRTVIFSTTSTSFHGQPNPVSGNHKIKRKSIALYYFSNGRPEESDAYNSEHSTLWAPVESSHN